ncbi:23S rRNA (pseudouridine(1915)-N(3))-methyltransferase RlmH [Mycoplasma marinum]|uniref:Ribosomal RNA large subunit methyltransferase H n=1 Tax=Mycoplasma marinum TaxID=1937190 RepID=A0A4R0XSL9_9MOLU|nr:23S rRNA (pseudouridine(1915)-N(3))-methyltransferase RlmH [Mycoplasma marinum]TCG11881.1 23S rRNA (pseudouridine(1915)-N(3))-methyltransferase RlmH [Mycoplasma marinum]
MKINIIAVGSLSKEYKTLYQDYAKKLGFYAHVRLSEVRPVNDKNTDIVKKKETMIIQSLIPKNSRVILCSLQGKQYSSEELSAKFTETDNITFVIGGSYGVDEEMFSEKIQFSKMTFPHQMFRVILVEQLFRAFSIKSGSKYHK